MPLDPIVEKLNKSCLAMVRSMDLNKLSATYKPNEGQPAVRVDIPCPNSKSGIANVEFLGAILDVDPKLLTIFAGGNDGYVSFRMKLEGKGNPKDVSLIKKEVVEAIEHYKNATPKEQAQIAENAVKHYQWLEKNNGYDLEGSNLEVIKKDIQADKERQTPIKSNGRG